MTVVDSSQRVRAASLEELRKAGRLVVAVNGHTVFLLADGDDVHAVDNRCPHMGFPLHRGSVSDGILTCHWHHARFDLCTGGTFDQWADELRRFPVEVRFPEADGPAWLTIMRGDQGPPRQRFWVRSRQPLPDEALHGLRRLPDVADHQTCGVGARDARAERGRHQGQQSVEACRLRQEGSRC